MDPVAQSTFYMLFTHQFEVPKKTGRKRRTEKNRDEVPEKTSERQANIESLRKNFAFTCPILDIGFVRHTEKFAKGGFSGN